MFKGFVAWFPLLINMYGFVCVGTYAHIWISTQIYAAVAALGTRVALRSGAVGTRSTRWAEGPEAICKFGGPKRYLLVPPACSSLSALAALLTLSSWVFMYFADQKVLLKPYTERSSVVHSACCPRSVFFGVGGWQDWYIGVLVF